MQDERQIVLNGHSDTDFARRCCHSVIIDLASTSVNVILRSVDITNPGKKNDA
jgi:hypothetical protein